VFVGGGLAFCATLGCRVLKLKIKNALTTLYYCTVILAKWGLDEGLSLCSLFVFALVIGIPFKHFPFL